MLLQQLAEDRAANYSSHGPIRQVSRIRHPSQTLCSG